MVVSFLGLNLSLGLRMRIIFNWEIGGAFAELVFESPKRANPGILDGGCNLVGGVHPRSND